MSGISRRHVIVAPVFAVVALGTVSYGHTDTRSEIVRAALAPYVAFVEKDAHGLCNGFVPRVAKDIGAGESDRDSCTGRVAAIFKNRRSLGWFPSAALVRTFVVEGVTWNGDRGKVTVSYYVTGGRARFQLALKTSGDGWRVSTAPIIATINGCRIYEGHQRCSRAGDVLFFGVAEPVVSGPPQITPPPTVRQAGGTELHEFEAGSRVAVDSGCLACHRIGMQGNDGPGPALTKVGNLLSPEQIKAAIVTPTAPMPSFRNLPKEKLVSLVKFLSLLK